MKVSFLGCIVMWLVITIVTAAFHVYVLNEPLDPGYMDKLWISSGILVAISATCRASE